MTQFEQYKFKSMSKITYSLNKIIITELKQSMLREWENIMTVFCNGSSSQRNLSM